MQKKNMFLTIFEQCRKITRVNRTLQVGWNESLDLALLSEKAKKSGAMMLEYWGTAFLYMSVHQFQLFSPRTLLSPFSNVPLMCFFMNILTSHKLGCFFEYLCPLSYDNSNIICWWYNYPRSSLINTIEVVFLRENTYWNQFSLLKYQNPCQTV